MSVKSLNQISSALEQFSSQHLSLKRYQCSFFESFDNFSTEDTAFPILYAIPDGVSFEENINTFTFRVYCVDMLQKDRSNEADVLNDTLLILRDLTNWLRQDDYTDLNILNTPSATPVNNFGIDFTLGWYVDFEIEVEADTSQCIIPFSSNFILTGITADYSVIHQYLSCNTLEDCDTFINLQNRVTALEGFTADTNTYVTGATFSDSTLTLTRNDGVDISVSGFSSEDIYTTGATLVGDVVYFDTTASLSAYTLDLSTLSPDLPALDYLPLSGGTLSGNVVGPSFSASTLQANNLSVSGTGTGYVTSMAKFYDGNGQNLYSFTDAGRFVMYNPAGTHSLKLEAQGTTGVSEITSTLGTIYFGSNAGEYQFRNLAGGRVLYYSNGQRFDFSATVGGSANLTIDTSGNVGIGTTAPTAGKLLDVAGNAYVRNGLTADTFYTPNTILDASGVNSLTTINRAVFDTTGQQSILWGSRLLQDGVSSQSIDWGSRKLHRADTSTSLSWNNSTLNNSAGTIVLDWSSGLSANTITATTYYGDGSNLTGVVPSYAGIGDRMLEAASGGTVSATKEIVDTYVTDATLISGLTTSASWAGSGSIGAATYTSIYTGATGGYQGQVYVGSIGSIPYFFYCKADGFWIRMSLTDVTTLAEGGTGAAIATTASGVIRMNAAGTALENSTYTIGQNLLTTSIVTFGGVVAGPYVATPVSPTALAANTNNWNTSSTNTFQRISASAAYNVTGIIATSTGAIRTYVNVGSFAITFTHEDAASTAANRILSSTGANITLNPNGSVTFLYDGTSARWRDISLR